MDLYWVFADTLVYYVKGYCRSYSLLCPKVSLLILALKCPRTWALHCITRSSKSTVELIPNVCHVPHEVSVIPNHCSPPYFSKASPLQHIHILGFSHGLPKSKNVVNKSAKSCNQSGSGNKISLDSSYVG